MNETKTKKPLSIHELLAHSYMVFFVSFLFGVILEVEFPLSKNFMDIGIGYTLLFLGTVLVLWAQNTSRSGKKERLSGNVSSSNFFKGPYKITRTPTHLGMLLTVLGAGFVWGSLWMICGSVVAYLITKFTFVKKEEEILEERYGAPYLEYKKKIKI